MIKNLSKRIFLLKNRACGGRPSVRMGDANPEDCSVDSRGRSEATPPENGETSDLILKESSRSIFQIQNWETPLVRRSRFAPPPATCRKCPPDTPRVFGIIAY